MNAGLERHVDRASPYANRFDGPPRHVRAIISRALDHGRPRAVHHAEDPSVDKRPHTHRYVVVDNAFAADERKRMNPRRGFAGRARLHLEA